MNEFKKNIFKKSTESVTPPFPSHTVYSFPSNCGGGYKILISTVTLDSPATEDYIFGVKTDITTTGDCSDTTSMLKSVTILFGETYGTSEGCSVSGQIEFPVGGTICDSYLI